MMKNILIGKAQEIPEYITVMAYVDPAAGSDVPDEYEAIKTKIIEILPEIPKINFKCVEFEVKGGISPSDFFDRKADIYVYDFGGMDVMGSGGLTEFNNRELAEKIQNEPGRLFILWSEFTSNDFWDQVRYEFPELVDANNVLTINDDPKEFDFKVASWFGLKRE